MYGEHAGALIERLDRSSLDPGRLAEMEGRLASVRGRPKDAVQYLTEAVAHGDTPERQLLLARAENDAGESGKAAIRVENVLRKDAILPDALAASAWVALGVLRWRDGKPKEALAAYDRALARAARASEPVSPVAVRINKGLALIDLARFDDALAEFAQAETELARFPNFKHQGLILQNRGMALLRRGDVQAAQDVWRALLVMVDDGVNPGIEASTVHNLAATADSLGDPVASIGYSLQAERLRKSLGDVPNALSSRINVAAKLYSVGLAEEGVRMAEVAATQAQALARPDLEARARLAGAMSVCVIEPERCIALFEASAAQFASQDNKVKLLETLEKLATFAFEHGDRATLERTIASFSEAMAGSSEADPGARLALLRALATRDPAVLGPFAKDHEGARRGLVHLALERGEAHIAQQELERLPEEASDRYWLLRERVAAAANNASDAARARGARASLRARVQALLSGA